MKLHLFLLIFTEFDWALDPPEINLNALRISQETLEDDDQEGEQAQNLGEHEEHEEDTPDDALEIVKNINDLLELSAGLGQSVAGLRQITDDLSIPEAFVGFERNGEKVLLRKSTILWMMTTATNSKVSSDRLHRFEDSEKGLGEADYIKIGDFIRINWKNNLMVCNVLGFKFRNKKFKFKNSFCPIHHKDGPNGGQGVGMLVDFYEINEKDGVDTLTNRKNFTCYVNVDFYIEHLKTTRNNITQAVRPIQLSVNNPRKTFNKVFLSLVIMVIFM